MSNYANFKDQGTTTADNLLAGEYPRVSELVNITGGNYKRGSVLGKITESGDFTISNKVASDGSQRPCAILAENVDASDEDKQAVVYFTGEFNKNALILGIDQTIDGIAAELKSNSIFLKTNQGY